MQICSKLFYVALGLGVAASSARADETDFTAMFAKTNQSMWTSGSALVIDTGTQRVGPDPWNLGKEVGTIVQPCDFCGSYGAKVGASTTGNLALEYGVKLNTGSVDVTYPANVSLTSPDAYATTAGNAYTIGSSFSVPGFQAGPSAIHTVLGSTTAVLQAHSPDLQAFVDLKADLHAFIGAEVCTGLCQGPALAPPDVHASQELASINRNGNHEVHIDGQIVKLDQNWTSPDGNVTGRLNIPSLNAVSTAAAGSTKTDLVSFKRDNIAGIDANVSNIIAAALGLPISGTYGPIGYNLLNVNAGLALDVKQTLSLDITPMVTLDFTSPVEVKQANGSWSAATKETSFKLGDNVTLRNGINVKSVGVIPKISLLAQLTNTTDLVLQGDFSVQAVAANIAGQTIGPLLDTGPITGDLGDIQIYKNTFGVNLDPVTGQPFNILEAIGFSGITNFETAQLFDVPGRGPGSQDRILQCDTAGSGNLNDPCIDTPQLAGLTSFHVDDDFNNPVYFDNLDGFDLAAVLQSIGTNDEWDQWLLSQLGFNAAGTPFVVPQGAPLSSFQTPEPSDLGLFFAGLLILSGRRRRR
jgi:hypothetical protein